jgi:hypothetical protein
MKGPFDADVFTGKLKLFGHSEYLFGFFFCSMLTLGYRLSSDAR